MMSLMLVWATLRIIVQSTGGCHASRRWWGMSDLACQGLPRGCHADNVHELPIWYEGLTLYSVYIAPKLHLGEGTLDPNLLFSS